MLRTGRSGLAGVHRRRSWADLPGALPCCKSNDSHAPAETGTHRDFWQAATAREGAEKSVCPTTPAAPFPAQPEMTLTLPASPVPMSTTCTPPSLAKLTGALTGHARVPASGQILDRQTRTRHPPTTRSPQSFRPRPGTPITPAAPPTTNYGPGGGDATAEARACGPRYARGLAAVPRLPAADRTWPAVSMVPCDSPAATARTSLLSSRSSAISFSYPAASARRAAVRPGSRWAHPSGGPGGPRASFGRRRNSFAGPMPSAGPGP